MQARARLVIVHRWLGLVIALFLVLTGLTGSLLAWEHELDTWLAPWLHRAEAPSPNHPLMSGLALREAVARQVGPQVQVLGVSLNNQPGETVRLRVRATPGEPTLAYDEVYANPHTGAIQGTRDGRALHWGREYIMPILFELHCSLALPGQWGTVILGVVSLLWTIDCFIGLWVTLPKKGRLAGSLAWWRAWKTSWTLKRGAPFYRRNLDLHRAGGLWLWAMLFVFAWSSVMFNLRPVWQPVMALAFDFDDGWRQARSRVASAKPPALDWQAGLDASRRAMAQLAARQGLRLDFEQQIAYNPGQRTYVYMVHSSADLRRHVGNTAVMVDADTGAYVASYLPSGAAAGNTIGNWMGALHMGHVFGLPYRVFVCVLGLVVVALSGTGLYIWWKKRQGRLHARALARRSPRKGPTAPVTAANEASAQTGVVSSGTR